MCLKMRHENIGRVMSTVIEMPGGLQDLDKLFDLMGLLENKETLIQDFKPEVDKYLVNKQFFKGPFRIKYNQMFDELITRLIKSQVTQHFTTWSPEEILLLTDTEILKLLAEELFNPDSYAMSSTDTALN